jgi:hypothetical protein
MKIPGPLTPVAAAVLTAMGCAPMETVTQDDGDDDQGIICVTESPIGSHVKEHVCRPDPAVWSDDRAVAAAEVSEDDVDVVFRDIKIEKFESRPIPLPEGRCGAPEHAIPDD